MALFYLMFCLVLMGMHLFVGATLVQLLRLSGHRLLFLVLPLAGLFLFSILAFPLSRALPRAVGHSVAMVFYVWLGVLLLFVVMAAAGHVLGLAVSSLPFSVFPAAASRDVLMQGIGVSVFLGTAILSGLALANGRRMPEVKEVVVGIPGLPDAFEGLRIVQLTDLHIGAPQDGAWLSEVVRRTNALGADMVAITGDLVDGSVAELRDDVAPLAGLRAPLGVYFITGNHEYYSGVPAWSRHVADMGIRVLRNESVRISRAGAHINLVGVDDESGRRMAGQEGPDLSLAFAGILQDVPTILLAHQPVTVRRLAPYRVDLQLSGHTHGGQIWPFGYLVRFSQTWLGGLYRVGETRLYVSMGTGCWGPPMRLGAPSEITVLTLVKE